MKLFKKLRSFCEIILILVFVLNTPFGVKEHMDKKLAREILHSTYDPMVNLVTKGDYVDYDYFKLDSAIDEERFIDLMNNMSESSARSIYEDIFDGIRDYDGSIMDGHLYIPTINNKGSKIEAAYIKKRKNLINRILNIKTCEEVMVIKESWNIPGSNFRTNHFKRDKEGSWILDRGNGTAIYKFNNLEDNPWNYDRNMN